MRTLKHSPIFLCMMLFMQNAFAQVCSDPNGTIYGMDNSGAIFPINVSTAVVGARVNPAYPGNAPLASNAIGYNPSNGRFYYFKRNADQTPQEFVSFNPSNNTYNVLTSCPSTNNIRTGCVDPLGVGYYCIDAAGNLYFYRFSSDKWKFITNTYFDQFGTNVTAALVQRSSGDIAMDGWGDMWFLCSDNTSYGLYYFRGSLPTSTVASLTIRQKVAPTTPTPGGTNFAGIGFSSTGQIYISQAGDKLYRMNNNFSLTFIGTFTTANVGGDLTSCVFPFAALAITQRNLTVQSMGNDEMQLTWSSQDLNVKGFFVEMSNDAQKWTTLGYIESNNTSLSNTKYTFTYQAKTSGRYYYRIRQVGEQGQFVYSEVKFIDIQLNNFISVGPNPTKGVIRIANNANAFSVVCVLDVAGHTLKQLSLRKGINFVNIGELPNGTYLLRFQSGNGPMYHQKILKE